MKKTLALAEKVRKGEPIPAPIAMALTMATPLVRFGMWKRYLTPRVAVDAHVVSIGNITAGGTGKTPAVIERASVELEAGRRVAVLTRGYGSSSKREQVVVRAGDRTPTAGEWLGDEPELMARVLPDLVIGKGPDRVATAKQAIKEFECDTLILDDGFQYLRLKRDENIVVVDATNPFGNGRLLPRGILREPLRALRRATHVIVTRCDQVADCDWLQGQLERFCPQAPVRLTRHSPSSLWRVSDGRRFRLTDLAGQQVKAVCGIGNPDSFFATLESLGATIIEREVFPDHSIFPAEALQSDHLVVMTEKDAVRMKFAADNVLALGVTLQDLDAPRSGWDWAHNL